MTSPSLEDLARRLAAVEQQLAEQSGLRASQDQHTERLDRIDGQLAALATTSSTIVEIVEQLLGEGGGS